MKNASRPRRLVLVTILGSSFLAAAGGDAPVPWPHGEAPSPLQVAAIVDEALVLADRDRFEEFLAAKDEGEASEHVFVLQDWIDQGQFDTDRLFQFGDAFFNHEFAPDNGVGDDSLPQLRRVHTGVRGGFDTYSCAGCHSVGGADGAGSFTQNAFVGGDGENIATANVRNAPPVIGGGFVEMLGAEMSANLAAIRDNALSKAASTGADVTALLISKGVSFGQIVARPDGSVDTSGVEGVDPDLVVKPFGWKGNVAKLRRFAEEAARIHFGAQSHILALQYKENPDVEKLGPGPNWWDPDNDGAAREVEEGTLTAVGVYMAMLEVPVMLPPYDPDMRTRWGRGFDVFNAIGCVDCHRTEMPLDLPYFREYPDTTGAPPVEFNIFEIGERPRGNAAVKIFSDLKRHDMGDELADPFDHDKPIGRSVFLTRPLWGLADSPPYLHDGRAATIPEAILAHGGEAKESRDKFVALDSDAQKDLHVFLLSLSRESRLVVLP